MTARAACAACITGCAADEAKEKNQTKHWGDSYETQPDGPYPDEDDDVEHEDMAWILALVLTPTLLRLVQAFGCDLCISIKEFAMRVLPKMQGPSDPGGSMVSWRQIVLGWYEGREGWTQATEDLGYPKALALPLTIFRLLFAHLMQPAVFVYLVFYYSKHNVIVAGTMRGLTMNSPYDIQMFHLCLFVAGLEVFYGVVVLTALRSRPAFLLANLDAGATLRDRLLTKTIYSLAPNKFALSCAFRVAYCSCVLIAIETVLMLDIITLVVSHGPGCHGEVVRNAGEKPKCYRDGLDLPTPLAAAFAMTLVSGSLGYVGFGYVASLESRPERERSRSGSRSGEGGSRARAMLPGAGSLV
eukprot:g2394.t1